MIACASPAISNTEETLNTLRYADRARQIQNRAVVNRDAISEQIHKLNTVIKKLQVELVMEHFKLAHITWEEIAKSKEYWAYLEEKMNMKVDIGDDSNMPSVFSEFESNPLGGLVNVNKRRQQAVLGGGEGDGNEGGVAGSRVDKVDLNAAKAQLEQIAAMMASKKGPPTSARGGAPPVDASIDLAALRKTLEDYEEMQKK